MPFASLLFSALAYLVLRSLWASVRTRRGAAFFVGGAALVHAAYFAARHPGAGFFATLTQGLLTTWFIAVLGVVVVGTPIALALWLHRRFSRSATAPAPALATAPVVDPRRREFLGMAVPVAAASVGATGTASAMGGFEVRHEELKVPGLPTALDGFRIGQLTDVHIGEFIDTEYLTQAVDALDAAGVDLQVMTGDLIDDLDQLEATMDALERCKAPLGMMAVLGNHEKWRGEQEVIDAYARRAPNGRLRLLIDENHLLHHRGTPLRVVGVDYPMQRGGRRHRLPPEERIRFMRASADAAWRGVGSDEVVLCLTHHPDFFPVAAERGAQVTLAGHTHGGQVGFFRVPLFSFAFEHMLGRYRRGKSQLYVSGGTGHWLPFRVGIPAEVTVLTLRAA